MSPPREFLPQRTQRKRLRGNELAAAEGKRRKTKREKPRVPDGFVANSRPANRQNGSANFGDVAHAVSWAAFRHAQGPLLAAAIDDQNPGATSDHLWPIHAVLCDR
jgi:hypothetical protein